EYVFNELIANSFGKTHKDPYLLEIQQSINVNVLKQIMNLAVSDASYFQVQAKANEAIGDIYLSLLDKKKSVRPYASQYGRMISEFRDHPEKFKLEQAPRIPDGSP